MLTQRSLPHNERPSRNHITNHYFHKLPQISWRSHTLNQVQCALVTRKSAGITRGIARVRYHQMLCNLRENRRNATKAVSPLNLGRRSTGTCLCFRQSQLSQLIFCRIFSRDVVLLHCSLHGSSVEVTRLIDDAQQRENLQAIHALHGRWI